MPDTPPRVWTLVPSAYYSRAYAKGPDVDDPTDVFEAATLLEGLREIAGCECPAGSRCPVHGESGPVSWEEIARTFHQRARALLSTLTDQQEN